MYFQQLKKVCKHEKEVETCAYHWLKAIYFKSIASNIASLLKDRKTKILLLRTMGLIEKARKSTKNSTIEISEKVYEKSHF